MIIKFDIDLNPMLEACDELTKAVLSDALAKTAKDSMMPVLAHMRGFAMVHQDTGLLLSSLGYRVKKNYKQNHKESGRFAFTNGHILRVKVGMLRKEVSRKKIRKSTSLASSRAIAAEWRNKGFTDERNEPLIRSALNDNKDLIMYKIESKFLANLMAIQLKKSGKYKA